MLESARDAYNHSGRQFPNLLIVKIACAEAYPVRIIRFNLAQLPSIYI